MIPRKPLHIPIFKTNLNTVPISSFSKMSNQFLTFLNFKVVKIFRQNLQLTFWNFLDLKCSIEACLQLALFDILLDFNTINLKFWTTYTFALLFVGLRGIKCVSRIKFKRVNFIYFVNPTK